MAQLPFVVVQVAGAHPDLAEALNVAWGVLAAEVTTYLRERVAGRRETSALVRIVDDLEIDAYGLNRRRRRNLTRMASHGEAALWVLSPDSRAVSREFHAIKDTALKGLDQRAINALVEDLLAALTRVAIQGSPLALRVVLARTEQIATRLGLPASIDAITLVQADERKAHALARAYVKAELGLGRDAVGHGTGAGGMSAQSARVQVGTPPRVAVSYQARPEVLKLIAEGLADAGSAVLGQVVASGMGGVGKTQLAVAAFEASASDLRVWVTASAREAVIAVFAEAAVRVGAAEVGGLPEWAAVRLVEHLATWDRSWLVVLDDVSREDDLTGLVPHGPSGAVLVTTRCRQLDIGAARRVDIDVFTAAEARAYLDRALTSAPDPLPTDGLVEADQLAAEVGYLPLALSHAAAVISFDGITCAEYRRRFADRTGALEDLIPQWGLGDYRHTIATTWSLAIEQADAMRPVGLARPALELAAVLDPNGVPDILWATTAAQEYATTHRTNPPSTDERVGPDELRRALRNLHHLHLLSHHRDGGPQAVRTHALVQRSITDTLTPEKLGTVVRAAADALEAIWPDLENDPALAQALRANVTALSSQPTNELWVQQAHSVLSRTGRSLGEGGLVAQAIDYFIEMAGTADRLLGPDHVHTLAARHSIARWRGEAGDLRGAVTALEELLTDQLRVLGPDHPDTLTTRHDIARWRGEAGDPRGAATAFEELLTNTLRIHGPNDPGILTTRHSIALWRGEAGDPTAAITALEQLLPDQIRVLGPDHPDTLTTRRSLARWHGREGRPQDAVTALDELLADHIRVLGTDHPETLITRHYCAFWRGKAGDPAAAATALEQLLPDQIRVFGADHPETLLVRGDLARWQGEAGDHQRALIGFERLLIDKLRILGPDHPHTLATRQFIAGWKGESGDAAAAVADLEHLLHDQVRILGYDHPDTVRTRHSLDLWRGVADSQ